MILNFLDWVGLEGGEIPGDMLGDLFLFTLTSGEPPCECVCVSVCVCECICV